MTIRRGARRWIAAVPLLAVVLLGACDGGDEEEPTPTATDPTVTITSGDPADPSDTETSTDDPTDEPTADNHGSDVDWHLPDDEGAAAIRVAAQYVDAKMALKWDHPDGWAQWVDNVQGLTTPEYQAYIEETYGEPELDPGWQDGYQFAQASDVVDTSDEVPFAYADQTPEAMVIDVTYIVVRVKDGDRPDWSGGTARHIYIDVVLVGDQWLVSGEHEVTQ